MTKKELRFTGWGFVLWFVNINVMGMDILPDFVGIIFLGYVLYRISRRRKITWVLIPLTVLLGIDKLIHWFLSFDLPLEGLLIHILTGYYIYVFLGIVISGCRETEPKIAKGIRVCSVAYIALQIFDFVSMALEILWLMLMEVAAAWIITLVLFLLLWKVTPEKEK